MSGVDARRRAGLFLAVLAAGFCLSCSGPVVTAVGNSNDMVVVGDAGRPSTTLLVSAMETPSEWLIGEPAFDTVVTGADRVGDLRNIRHVVLVGTWDSDVAHLARQAFPRLGREDPVMLRTTRDVWAKRQVVGVLLAETEKQLAAYIEERRSELASAFERASINRLADDLRETAEEAGMAGALQERFGWSIAPPTGYDFFTTSSEEGFVFFRRTGPDRSVFVYWTEGGDDLVTADFALTTREELAAKYYDGDETERRRPLLTETVDFLGFDAVRISGWWGNKELVGGGPFRTYCFRVEPQGRVYLLDVSLFAPSYDKIPLMRNLDAVAHTFTPALPD